MSLALDLGAAAPILTTAVGAAVVLLLTVAGGSRRPAPGSAAHLVLGTLLACAVSAVLLVAVDRPATGFGGAVVVDGISITFGLVTLVGAAVAALMAASYLREHELSHGEFLALLLLSTTGMLILVMAGDLITLFIGLETMSLAVYVLSGYRRASRRSQEAALKYFIYGAFASAFTLFGIALVYGEVGRITGTPAVDLAAIGRCFGGAADASVSLVGWVAVTMVLGGLVFKVAAVPFHMWAPDVYEGAPTPSTGFMAVGIKAAAFAGLVRFVGASLAAAGSGTETAIQVFEVLAVLTMVLGNLVAVRQRQIKRMLAYSSIAHAGYALVGVAAYIAQPSGDAIGALAFYLLAYTAMTVGAFGIVIAFERRDDRRRDVEIDRLSGAGLRYPALGLAMVVFMFSLAGVPPTAGFFGKLGLLAAAVEADRIAVVVVAVLASVVGAYYYLRVLVVMYMGARDTDERHVASPWLAAGLVVCALITVGLGLLPESSLHFARSVLGG